MPSFNEDMRMTSAMAVYISLKGYPVKVKLLDTGTWLIHYHDACPPVRIFGGVIHWPEGSLEELIFDLGGPDDATNQVPTT